MADSTLLQVWCTPRLREALRLVANKLGSTQSRLVRLALWDYLQRHLSRRDLQQLDALPNENRRDPQC